MQRVIATISGLVMTMMPLAAQTAEALPGMPRLSPYEWSRLRSLTESLRTTEGCRRVFRSQPDLASAYASEEFFLSKMVKWQGRIQPIDEKQEQARDLSMEVLHRDDGTQIYYLTFHHREPANAITILKSVWRADSLVAVDLMRGFAKVPFSSADYQPSRHHYYMPPPNGPASQGKSPYSITTGSAH